MRSSWRTFFVLVLSAFALVSCGSPPASEPASTGQPPSVTSGTPSPISPTATSEPLAAMVGSEAISLNELKQEILRFEAAQRAAGIDLATLGQYQSLVLEALIDRRLLAMEARRLGLSVGQEELADRLQQLSEEVGGEQAMLAWLAENHYSEAEFRVALEQDLLAAKMVAEIVSALGPTEEQVRARHILVGSLSEARQLRERIAAGANFAAMAQAYSRDLSTRMTGGDLGWFPKGFLTVPEVEEAAFSLGPGELSQVVESELGFHLVETLDRGAQPLSPEATRRRNEQAVEDWLAQQRLVVAIEILVAP